MVTEEEKRDLVERSRDSFIQVHEASGKRLMPRNGLRLQRSAQLI